MKREELIKFASWFDTFRDIPKYETKTNEELVGVYLSLTPAVKESEKPITAGEILKSHLRRYINTLHATEPIQLMALSSLISVGWYKDVINAMEEYASKPTVAEREVGQKQGGKNG